MSVVGRIAGVDRREGKGSGQTISKPSMKQGEAERDGGENTD